MSLGRVQVARWRERYAQHRLAGIERDRPRGAPPPKVDVARLVELTTQSKPAAATHWSTRTMAAEMGISAANVSHHWRANGLKPHLVRGFKISRDPQFV
ncbi:transposase, partial [mine drainage metagenome]